MKNETKNVRPTKENIEYWKKRFEDLELLTEKNNQDYIENLDKQFRLASFRIKQKLDRFYSMFAEEEEISLQEAKRLLNSEELEEFHMSVEEYMELMDEYDKTLDEDIYKKLQRASLKYRVTRLEATELQLMCEVITAYTGVESSFFNTIRDAYIDRYYRSAFTIFQGYGIGTSLATIDQSALKRLLDKPWTADGKNFSSRIWNNKRKLIDNLDTELIQALISGYSYSETSERLAKKMNAEVRKCATLIATESAYFSSVAQLESWKELDVEEYEIVATLDSKTSDICRHQDGEIYSISQFRPGETAPPFHVNCRTTTCPYFDDTDVPGYVSGERAARNPETGKTYTVPADMNYLEWYEKEVKKTKKDYKGVFKQLPEDHVKKMQNLLSKAPDNIRKVWDNCIEKINCLDYEAQDRLAYYSSYEGGIRFNLEKDSKGNSHSNSYTIFFHESGHNIDYILNQEYGNGDSNTAFTEVFQKGKLGKTVKKEARKAIEDYFADNINRFYPNFTGEDLRKAARYATARQRVKLEDMADRYDDHEISLEDILANSVARRKLMDYKDQLDYDIQYEFLTDLSNSLSDKQKYDISDMFQPILHSNCHGSLGFGHEKGYWKGRDNGKEVFAEMFSATICNPESLEQILRFFPDSYQIFLQMLEEAS